MSYGVRTLCLTFTPQLQGTAALRHLVAHPEGTTWVACRPMLPSHTVSTARGEQLVIDHVGLGVSDLEQCRAFYQQALGPLGYQLLMERDGSAGFGRNGKPDFWIHVNRPLSGPTHVAIASPDRATVQAFHAAGLAAGGRDNGPPGLRPQYHQDYYGAFVLDPDGNNIEAVCHQPS
jgi:catechol 2,3-dioxygenase-like lactoylglutathione lyase family enzyme